MVKAKRLSVRWINDGETVPTADDGEWFYLITLPREDRKALNTVADKDRRELTTQVEHALDNLIKWYRP